MTQREAARTFYEDFSLAVGLRDWLRPNPRHQQLKRLLAEVLSPRSEPRLLLDVGCGVGVMTAHLRRYGKVHGTDFSTAAIGAARKLVPHVEFRSGTLDDLPDLRWDVITLFDVLEHIPAGEREAFLGALACRLAPDGMLFVSTPHPLYTAFKRASVDRHLQIIDEEVELGDVVREAGPSGLQLVHYRAHDVFEGSPEYQVMVFVRGLSAGGAPRLIVPPRRPHPALPSRLDQALHRVRLAAHLAAHGRRRAARWALFGRPPHVES